MRSHVESKKVTLGDDTVVPGLGQGTWFMGENPRIIEQETQALQRLGTDRLDLYLLHWRVGIPLEETFEGIEQLKKRGKSYVGEFQTLIQLIWDE